MGVVFTILTVLVILASVLMTVVVLLQNSKGGGLASNFAVGNQTFGVRKTADILEKVTWGLVAFIFVLSIVTTFTTGNRGGDDFFDNVEQNEAGRTPDFAPLPQDAPASEIPAQEAPAQEAPAADAE